MLELNGLSRRYGDTVALDGLSLEVREGELLGFVGPNGAGKTTAMRIALGVLEPDAGELLWRRAPATRKVQRQFGYMPEERGLYPKMQVDRQLAVAGSIVPLSSPIIMPSMVALGEASVVQLVASLALFGVAIALLVPAGARIYENAVLRMGKPLKLREAWNASPLAR